MLKLAGGSYAAQSVTGLPRPCVDIVAKVWPNAPPKVVITY